jgi:uncharacterized membrane protein YbhN (UPF0104 family)
MTEPAEDEDEPRSRRVEAMTRRAGNVLAALGVAFVSWTLWSHRGRLAAFSPTMADVMVLVGCVVAYGLAAILLGQAWRLLLAFRGGELTPREAHEVYGRSQIAKYVPGNVAQIAGRHALAAARGVRGTVSLASAAHELAALVAAAGVIAVPTVLAMERSAPFKAVTFGVVILGAILVECAVVRTARATRSQDGGSWSRLAGAHALHLVFFAVMGAATAAVASATSGWPGLPEAFEVAGMASVAWIAGFVTPGAPAGLGVREAVLVGLLSTVLAPDAAVLVAALMRLVTIGGDLLCFASAIALGSSSRQPRLQER